jgi:uncharacterized protein YciI
MTWRPLVVATVILALALPAVAIEPADEQDVPIPTDWSTHFVWFLLANPDYEPASKSADSAVTSEHIQYQLRLQREGKTIAGGGFAPLKGDPVVGMTILRAATREEAEAIAAADPAVRAGRLRVQIREWWVPTGHLP